ncbi:MAG: hypothetical protein ACOH1Y_12965 [Propionicimonas sp.]
MLWNSTVAYVLAQTVVIMLHEGAHTVAGRLLGYGATQFTGQVSFTPEPTATAAVVTIAMAGPLFSLASGLVAMRFRPFRGHGFAQLLWIWMAFLSAEEGFGYFFIAPIIQAGDTGTALAALAAPDWVGWLCGVVGVAGLIFLARRFAVAGARHTRDLYEMRAFCYYPWIIGTVSVVLLAALYLALTAGTPPDAAFAILIGAGSLGVFAPMAMIWWAKASPQKELLELPVPRAGLVALVVLVLVNVIILTPGLHFG